MNEETRKALILKNQRLIDMVIERAKRDYPDDIALIGLTGSFSTGDFHEGSDLDLIIINESDRAWGMAKCFILGDVGYDVYMTPWSPRVEAQAKLESPMVSHLLDLQILYCSKPEYMEKFQAYQRRAREELSKPIGEACLKRARKWLDKMKQDYASCEMEDEIGPVRYAAGGVLYNAVNALTQMNNTYIGRGIRRYREIVAGYEFRPEGFLNDFDRIVAANSVPALRDAALSMLRGVDALWRDMDARYCAHLAPTHENLKGTYEEFWCDCRGKVLGAAQSGDSAYLFLAAFCAQSYLDEMHGEVCGVQRFDLMRQFDARDPGAFRDSFLRVMDEYEAEYRKVGRAVERYGTFEELYRAYMG